jgi:hypothetical protein
MTASSFCVREPRWYYNTSSHAITVSKTTPICNMVTLFDLIDAERLKFLRRRRKPFRRRATFAWRAFVTSELVKLYGQQYYCSVCSWLQRNRDGGVDHLFGLGPVRAASLKSSPLGLVAALAQWAGQSAAHDALTLTQRRGLHHRSSPRHRPLRQLFTRCPALLSHLNLTYLGLEASYTFRETADMLRF